LCVYGLKSERKQEPSSPMGASEETAVVEMTRSEYENFLAREVDRSFGVAVGRFVEAYAAGELNDSDPEVARLAALLALGQNGAG
jgi:hypothetical protein